MNQSFRILNLKNNFNEKVANSGYMDNIFDLESTQRDMFVMFYFLKDSVMGQADFRLATYVFHCLLSVLITYWHWRYT
jgi:hypothetical protein